MTTRPMFGPLTQTLFAGIGPTVLNYPYSNYSDTFVVAPGGELAFYGNQGGAAVARLTENGVGVFLGFALEAMDLTTRQEVLTRFFDACAIDEQPLFADGFEGGDTSGWSSAAE